MLAGRPGRGTAIAGHSPAQVCIMSGAKSRLQGARVRRVSGLGGVRPWRGPRHHAKRRGVRGSHRWMRMPARISSHSVGYERSTMWSAVSP